MEKNVQFFKERRKDTNKLRAKANLFVVCRA